MIHHLWHLAIFNNWSMRASSFKQLELSKSLENTENFTKRFALLASVKSSSSNCLRAKRQLFWSHCRQLSFSTSQWVKRKIWVRKIISYRGGQELSQCTSGKQNYVIKNEKTLWLLLLEQQRNDRSSLFFSSKLAGLLFPGKFYKRASLICSLACLSNMILWLKRRIKLFLQGNKSGHVKKVTVTAINRIRAGLIQPGERRWNQLTN